MGRDPIKSDRKGFCLGSEIVAEIAVRKIVTVVSAAKCVNHKACVDWLRFHLNRTVDKN